MVQRHYFGLPEETRRELCLEILGDAGVIGDWSVEVRRYVEGELIPLAETGWICVLVEGFVRVRVGYCGYTGMRQATISLAGPWQLVWCGMDDLPGAEALTGCGVIRLPTASAGASAALLDLLEDLLAAYEGTAWVMLPRETRARLSRLLMLLAGRFGREFRGGGILVPLEPRRTDLAEMVAATRESVTQAMADLLRQRVLKVHSNGIIIEDATALAALADNP